MRTVACVGLEPLAFGVWMLIVVGLGSVQPSTASLKDSTADSAVACAEASKAALGPRAAVLKCGDLTGGHALEVVAAIRLRRFRSDTDGIPVSKLVILRKRAGTPKWVNQLVADRGLTRNHSGYVGVEYIDDSFQYTGYRVSFSDHRSDGVASFTIYLYDLSPGGRNEGIATEIAWNPAVRRFQWFCYECEQHAFRPEIKNPPHIRTRGCKCK